MFMPQVLAKKFDVGVKMAGGGLGCLLLSIVLSMHLSQKYGALDIILMPGAIEVPSDILNKRHGTRTCL
jgi:hypothetical protein